MLDQGHGESQRESQRERARKRERESHRERESQRERGLSGWTVPEVVVGDISFILYAWKGMALNVLITVMKAGSGY